MSRSIFGHELKNPAAYCKYHKGSLSVKQIKAKRCLQKQCRHLLKNEEHTYWQYREEVKKIKKERRRCGK